LPDVKKLPLYEPRFAVGLGALGALFVAFAARGGAAWLLLWPACSCFAVAAAYGGLGPRVFGKRPDGSRAWFALALTLPYLLAVGFIWHLQRTLVWRRDYFDEVSPRVFLGRRPLASDLPQGVDLVVDLTSEFRTHHARRAGAYICLPTLDGSAPDDAAFAGLVERVAAHEGVVYVHCAAGHGRSASVVAALLLRKGLARDVDEAEAMMRHVRPGVALSRSQRRAVERFAERLRQGLPPGGTPSGTPAGAPAGISESTPAGASEGAPAGAGASTRES
jgi:protein-tyrosine phosphatase